MSAVTFSNAFTRKDDETWPGNSTDVTSLLPVLRRLESRFGMKEICIVADRGMISTQTVNEIESKHANLRYILGARLRSTKEVRDLVIGRAGRYKQVHGPRQNSKDPSPLAVKDVRIGENALKLRMRCPVDQPKMHRVRMYWLALSLSSRSAGGSALKPSPDSDH